MHFSTRREFRTAVICILLSGSLTAKAQTPGKIGLSPAELHGKKVFLQRCSICHLPPLYEPESVKPYGPILDGYLRSTQSEERARKVIREGTPRMPGFQYGLQTAEIDDLIAYMKTLKLATKEGGARDANKERTGD